MDETKSATRSATELSSQCFRQQPVAPLPFLANMFSTWLLYVSAVGRIARGVDARLPVAAAPQGEPVRDIAVQHTCVDELLGKRILSIHS